MKCSSLLCKERELKYEDVTCSKSRNIWVIKKMNSDLLSWSLLSVITTKLCFLLLLSLVSLLFLYRFSPSLSFTGIHYFKIGEVQRYFSSAVCAPLLNKPYLQDYLLINDILYHKTYLLDTFYLLYTFLLSLLYY